MIRTEKNELKAIIAGMAQLGDIYLRITAKIQELYRQNPKLRLGIFPGKQNLYPDMASIGIREYLDILLQKTNLETMPQEEKQFWVRYALKYNDPILLEEILFEYAASVEAGRESMRSNLEEQMALFPDPYLGMADLEEFGYRKQDLYPISREIAMELFASEAMEIYCIYPGGGTEAVRDLTRLEQHPGMFGVKCRDWLRYHLEAFREGKNINFHFMEPQITFRIYQVREGISRERDYGFLPYDVAVSIAGQVTAEDYTLVYEGVTRKGTTLEDIFVRFNVDHPADFKGHSLSVSDVVMLWEETRWEAYYVDSIGFRKLEGFITEEDIRIHPEKELPKKDQETENLLPEEISVEHGAVEQGTDWEMEDSIADEVSIPDKKAVKKLEEPAVSDPAWDRQKTNTKHAR